MAKATTASNIRVGVLTVSTRAARGEYADHSGPLLVELLGSQTGWQVAQQATLPDDAAQIAARLRAWCDNEGLNLILTSGGTGFSPSDVTPEATRRVIEREAPGIAEALRAESLKITRHAMLSRAIAGIRGRCLIINLPGNPKAVREGWQILVPVLPHALDLLREAPHTEQDHRSV
jgi:molybdopterin adenylyltransferase